jgi:hypothetical protein
MVFKLYGLGIGAYLKDSYNLFDGILVILSLVDIFLMDFLFAGGGADMKVL